MIKVPDDTKTLSSLAWHLREIGETELGDKIIELLNGLKFEITKYVLDITDSYHGNR